MRIHTDGLTEDDVRDAARQAGVTFGRLTEHRSQSHARAFDVTLRGNSNRRPNPGSRGNWTDDERAATWDQWGVFLGILFDRDPYAMTDRKETRHAFRERTAYRFDGLDGAVIPFPLDHEHSWYYAGGAIRERSCRRCSATETFAF